MGELQIRALAKYLLGVIVSTMGTRIVISRFRARAPYNYHLSNMAHGFVPHQMCPQEIK